MPPHNITVSAVGKTSGNRSNSTCPDHHKNTSSTAQTAIVASGDSGGRYLKGTPARTKRERFPHYFAANLSRISEIFSEKITGDKIKAEQDLQRIFLALLEDHCKGLDIKHHLINAVGLSCVYLPADLDIMLVHLPYSLALDIAAVFFEIDFIKANAFFYAVSDKLLAEHKVNQTHNLEVCQLARLCLKYQDKIHAYLYERCSQHKNSKPEVSQASFVRNVKKLQQQAEFNIAKQKISERWQQQLRQQPKRFDKASATLFHHSQAGDLFLGSVLLKSAELRM